ncbi:DUF2513 domain-containing protein [Stutzerimonas kunmingensis]|uniref:DUF2513 domain-containing protein n=1 Tax=Stutzerimonas kunmingensis TaxID=1211807 RepID=UPI0028A6794C|nr:DUF2513 domain-containing protein [Stutzerimonas kunmingensis]
MDLIRLLLLKLENLATDGNVAHVSGQTPELQCVGYEPAQIDYHLSLISEAGLIRFMPGPLEGGLFFVRLSWDGHDFADAIRDDQIWARTRKGALAAGGFTMDLLKDLAIGFLRKQLEERTGISLG